MIRMMRVKPADFDDKNILEGLKQEARKGWLVVLKEENDGGMQCLVDWVCRKLSVCKELYQPGCSMVHVKLYVNALVDAADGRFAKSLASERKRDKYLCIVLGALMAHRVYVGTAGEMAKVFRMERLTGLSVKKYITLGQKDLHMRNIFLEADKNVSKGHT